MAIIRAFSLSVVSSILFLSFSVGLACGCMPRNSPVVIKGKIVSSVRNPSFAYEIDYIGWNGRARVFVENGAAVSKFLGKTVSVAGIGMFECGVEPKTLLVQGIWEKTRKRPEGSVRVLPIIMASAFVLFIKYSGSGAGPCPPIKKIGLLFDLFTASDIFSSFLY